jgi:hypothetical protein
MNIRFALIAAIGISLVLNYFDLIRIQIIPDRSTRLGLKDKFSYVKSKISTIDGKIESVKIQYEELIENDDNSTAWYTGTRFYPSNKVALIVVDIHDKVNWPDNLSQIKYEELITKINSFSSRMRGLGVDVIQSHSPWEGKKVSTALIQSHSDIIINSPEDERNLYSEMSKYDMVLLVGAAGNKCVLTRPLGVIELNRIGVQTVYLYDMMVFFGSPGKAPEFSPDPRIVEFVALNWGYVGSAFSIIEAQNKK